jgi:hypothetical protein
LLVSGAVTTQHLELKEALTHLLEECRMVLPGIQALFGFQMIAVFNSGFSMTLTTAEQKLHIAAIILVVVSIAAVMAPAALHRAAEPNEVSDRFLRVSSTLLVAGMVPLALGICTDLFLVTDVVCHSRAVAAIVATASALLFAALWFVGPAAYKRQSAS